MDAPRSSSSPINSCMTWSHGSSIGEISSISTSSTNHDIETPYPIFNLSPETMLVIDAAQVRIRGPNDSIRHHPFFWCKLIGGCVEMTHSQFAGFMRHWAQLAMPYSTHQVAYNYMVSRRMGEVSMSAGVFPGRRGVLVMNYRRCCPAAVCNCVQPNAALVLTEDEVKKINDLSPKINDVLDRLCYQTHSCDEHCPSGILQM